MKNPRERGFTEKQIAELRRAYSSINAIDPAKPTYHKLIAQLDAMTQAQLKQLAGANVQFVSSLARNRVRRKKNPGGVRVVFNKLLGGWYVVRGPHQTPLNGRFDSKQEAQAWLQNQGARQPRNNPRKRNIIRAPRVSHKKHRALSGSSYLRQRTRSAVAEALRAKPAELQARISFAQGVLIAASLVKAITPEEYRALNDELKQLIK